MFDRLEGVGPVRRRALLRHFGSAEAVLNATQDELEGVPGVPAEDGAQHLRAAAQGRSGLNETAQEAVAGGPRTALRVGTSRNFGPYFAGNAISATGTWFQNLAAALLVYRQTHSAFLLGVLNFAQFAPVLFLAPWTGASPTASTGRSCSSSAQAVAAALAATLAALAWADLAPAAVVMCVRPCARRGQRLHRAGSAGARPVARRRARSDGGDRAQLDDVQPGQSARPGARRRSSSRRSAFPLRSLLNAFSYLLFVVGLVVAVHPRPQRLAERGTARIRDSVALLRREPRLAVLLCVVADRRLASDPVTRRRLGSRQRSGAPTHRWPIIEATPPAIVGDRITEPRRPGKPLFLVRDADRGWCDPVTMDVAGGTDALRLLIGHGRPRRRFPFDADTIVLLWQGKVPTVISPLPAEGRRPLRRPRPRRQGLDAGRGRGDGRRPPAAGREPPSPAAWPPRPGSRRRAPPAATRSYPRCDGFALRSSPSGSGADAQDRSPTTPGCAPCA